MFSPSAHELDTIRSAYAEADSFSYSPVFFTSRVEDILDSSSHGSHRAFFMGRCPLDFPYFRPDWADQPGHVAFTLFVSAFYK